MNTWLFHHASGLGKQHYDKKEKGVVAFRRVVEIDTQDLIDPNTAKSGSKPPIQFAWDEICSNKWKTHICGLVFVPRLHRYIVCQHLQECPKKFNRCGVTILFEDCRMGDLKEISLCQVTQAQRTKLPLTKLSVPRFWVALEFHGSSASTFTISRYLTQSAQGFIKIGLEANTYSDRFFANYQLPFIPTSLATRALFFFF